LLLLYRKKKQTIKQILKQIIYDARLNPEDFYIIFRGTGERHVKVKFADIKLSPTGFFLNDTFIPYHRVLIIANEKNGVILLDRIRDKPNK